MSIMHKEITAALRQRLLSGEFKPGEVLPTTQELATRFAASVYTVHKAMAPLVEEGLLERRRNLGTVVRHHPEVLTCAGLYVSSGLLDDREFAFCRELCRQIQQQLSEAGVRTVLHMDMRPKEERGEPLPELVQAIDTCQIQALFVVLTDKVSTPWLRNLPVTTSYLSSNPSLNPVGFDSEQMLHLALSRLREQGCKRVGAISAITVPEDIHDPRVRFFDAYTSSLADLGLLTRDTWVLTPTEHVTSHERFGYDAIKRLWQNTERPDGLFIYPDTSARGAMMALLELGVRVPDELKVTCHRNKGVDWACPFPVSWVESDTAQCATEMIQQIRRQKAGETIEPVSLQYALS